MAGNAYGGDFWREFFSAGNDAFNGKEYIYGGKLYFLLETALKQPFIS